MTEQERTKASRGRVLCTVGPAALLLAAAVAFCVWGLVSEDQLEGDAGHAEEGRDDVASAEWLNTIDGTVSARPSADMAVEIVRGNMTGWRFAPVDVTVALDGSGDYTSVQAAVDAIPEFNNWQPDSGERHVYVSVGKEYVTLLGDDALTTVITWNANASAIAPDGQPWGTFNSCTVCVDAKYFVAVRITFQNEAPEPDYADYAGEGQQAVALRLSNDYAALYSSRFLGFQDTLCDHEGLHYFRNCYIEGTVDVINGNGTSIYEECTVHALRTPAYTFASLTAHFRSGPHERSGLVFLRCNVTGHRNATRQPAVQLGRAWGVYSRALFIYCFLDASIMPLAWDDWGDPGRRSTSFLGQYGCWGPGGVTKGQRAPWSHTLDESQSAPFISYSFIDAAKWLGPPPPGPRAHNRLPRSSKYSPSPWPIPKPPLVIPPEAEAPAHASSPSSGSQVLLGIRPERTAK
eukprot:jgi/Mesen1/1293/ME000013S00785